VNQNRAAQTAPALGAFVLTKVPAAGLIAQDFAARGDFEPLGHRFLGFDAFGTSHKFSFFTKERAV
jgi:hypothetical protein